MAMRGERGWRRRACSCNFTPRVPLALAVVGWRLRRRSGPSGRWLVLLMGGNAGKGEREWGWTTCACWARVCVVPGLLTTEMVVPGRAAQARALLSWYCAAVGSLSSSTSGCV